MDAIDTQLTKSTKGRYTYTQRFWTYDINVCEPTERACSCRWRFADRRRCSSQALRSRESIVERTDGNSGRRKIMIKACGINVQGTLPRACHIVLPYEMYGWLMSVISEGERCNVCVMSYDYECECKCEWVIRCECPRGLAPLCIYPFVTI